MDGKTRRKKGVHDNKKVVGRRYKCICSSGRDRKKRNKRGAHGGRNAEGRQHDGAEV